MKKPLTMPEETQPRNITRARAFFDGVPRDKSMFWGGAFYFCSLESALARNMLAAGATSNYLINGLRLCGA
jgi:hypothetical protein